MDTPLSNRPDYSGAVGYALRRLHAELSPTLFYHNALHTESDVLPAVVRLARMSNVSEATLHLLEVAAAFHDLGQIATSLGHEQISIDIMSEVLPGFGFSAEDIERVTGMILATRLPQSPQNEEQALLADADLDSLGREDFLATSKALWQERTASGLSISWHDWLESQLRFMRAHHYFTPAAQALRQQGKLKNIELMEQMIRAGQAAGTGADGGGRLAE